MIVSRLQGSRGVRTPRVPNTIPASFSPQRNRSLRPFPLQLAPISYHAGFAGTDLLADPLAAARGLCEGKAEEWDCE
eukprot:6903056-Pyramimonas_sp.AAC.1